MDPRFSSERIGQTYTIHRATTWLGIPGRYIYIGRRRKWNQISHLLVWRRISCRFSRSAQRAGRITLVFINTIFSHTPCRRAYIHPTPIQISNGIDAETKKLNAVALSSSSFSSSIYLFRNGNKSKTWCFDDTAASAFHAPVKSFRILAAAFIIIIIRERKINSCWTLLTRFWLWRQATRNWSWKSATTANAATAARSTCISICAKGRSILWVSFAAAKWNWRGCACVRRRKRGASIARPLCWRASGCWKSDGISGNYYYYNLYQITNRK